jgi:hypothetical protein
MAGWVVTVIVVVGTVAFFVGAPGGFAGTYSDSLNIAKVPLSAVIASYWGLSVTRSRVVSTGAGYPTGREVSPGRVTVPVPLDEQDHLPEVILDFKAGTFPNTRARERHLVRRRSS